MESIEVTSKNLTWYNGKVLRTHRERLHGHPSFLMWFTGLSASGKSTIAHHIEEELHRRDYSTYILDGDNIRHGLCSDLGFSEEERRENIRRVGEAAKLLIDAGVIVISALISPFIEGREAVRSLFKSDEFIEIYTKCPINICAERDYKGIYKKAMTGEIADFTGISSPYEEPENPEITLHTGVETPQESAEKVLQYLEQHILQTKRFKHLGRTAQS